MPVASQFGGGGNSRFADEYCKGAVPCRIDHGTCSHRISWDVPLEELRTSRDELLSLCVKGLRETKHPYCTIAHLAAVDLLSLPECDGLFDETIRDVMLGLRAALTAPPSTGAPSTPSAQKPPPPGAPRGGGTLARALEVLQLLARAEGPRLAQHIHHVAPPLGKHLLAKPHRGAVQDVVRELATHGGEEVAQVMRKRGIVIEM